jgi:hypothetical protein
VVVSTDKSKEVLMRTFEGIGDASTEVRKFLIVNEAKLPDHLQDRLMHLTGTGTSPVDLVVNFVEAVYANPKEFSAEAKDLAAGAAVVCEANGFHGMDADHRGSRISKVLSGEKLAKESHPEAKLEMREPQPEDPGREPPTLDRPAED